MESRSLDTVAESDFWGVKDAAFSNSCSDGSLLFEPVDVSTIDGGTISFSVETGAKGRDGFEGAGNPGADFVRVEISIDGGEFQLLDMFEVDPNDLGLAGKLQTFVGSETGQSFDADGSILSYGIPDGAGTVQLRLTTELTAVNEIIVVDDVRIGGEQTVQTGYETGLLANDGDSNGAGLLVVAVEGVDLFTTTETSVLILEEDFDGSGAVLATLDTVSQSDLVGHDGAAQANQRNEGEARIRRCQHCRSQGRDPVVYT